MATPSVKPAALSDKDFADFLFRAYVEAMAHARHQETVRSAVAGSVIALTTAALGVLGFLARAPTEGAAAAATLWPALAISGFVTVVGVSGALYCTRAAYRYRRLREGAKELYRDWGGFVGERGPFNPVERFDQGKARAQIWLTERRLGALFGQAEHLRQGVIIVWLMAIVAVVGGLMFAASLAALR